ncbi:MAG TPA: bis(5'-nucleosyl)-tetraphosphatase (symmetrical) YqeK [bacterium]|nr:bis(5'-nucleosyl)-tetraphosphatase (symmetrical) YqeK [bacterium]
MAEAAPGPQVVRWVKARVGPGRFRHIQGVARTAARLARRSGLSVPKALWAAWLHDSAKEMDRTLLLRWVGKSRGRMDPGEEGIPALWHPHAGVGLAREIWGIRDREILEAIRCHTLGSPGMAPVAQVIFVADFIEPGRHFPGVDRARAAAHRGLAGAVTLKCRMTIGHLMGNGRVVHPRLLETYNFFIGSGT